MSDLFKLDPAGERVVLSEAQRLAWLRLIRSEGVGPITFRDLLNRFGGAERALEGLPDLIRRGGALRTVKICSREEALREMDAATRLGVRFIAMGEEDYPSALRHAPAPPPLLAVRGNVGALKRPMVGMVGSRNASAIGLKFTRLLAQGLGEAGFTIVSGLARGVDGAAHEASLNTGTIAVLAGGSDRIYPPEHVDLAEHLLASGATASETPLGLEPRGKDFPRRNRLIAGMALGIVVVEAAERSGSLITARLALEAGREVFAVPGHPLDPRAIGTNGLLKQGAAIVRSVDDVLEVLLPQTERIVTRLKEPEPVVIARADAMEDLSNEDRRRIVAAMGPTGVEVDAILRATGLPLGAVQLVFLELELAGRLERQADGRVALI